MRKIALAMLFLNPVLWASFYAVSKDALDAVDPLGFSTLELTIAALPAMALLIMRRKAVTRREVVSGLRLGVSLYLAVIGSTIAVYFTTATNTAFFPALNGAFAAAIATLFLGQKLGKGIWISALLATVGAIVLISQSAASGGDIRGDTIALAAALAYTIYIFVVDYNARSGGDSLDLWSVCALEVMTMAGLGWVVTLATGGPDITAWSNPETLLAGVYIGLFTTVAPTIIALFFQRHVNPVTVAMIYVLEPIWGAIAAALVNGEQLTAIGYGGGVLIVLGSFIGAAQPEAEDQLEPVAAGE
ncbi:MAG: DMT family transporter [Phyllobacteriaceae bacterium]|nr:DMT family transporter [Phyllobacteriaceae bacterium]